jgi:uncharacterized RDD family membrane protein YckC
MKPTHVRTVVLLTIGLLGPLAGAPAAQRTAGARAVPVQMRVQFERPFRFHRPIVRVGLDYTVQSGDEVREVLMVLGNVTIEGQVDRDVIVVFGDARLAQTARVGGSLVVLAGDATVAEGAAVDGDLAVAGGRLDAPGDFAPGGEHVIVGAPVLGQRVRALVPWLTRGLLWGRLIVPDVPWVWAVVGVIFLVSLVINQLFAGPVRASAEAVAHRPFGAFLMGLVVMVVSAPLVVLLAASVVGLVVVPVFICAGLAVLAIGKVGVARGIGLSIVGQSDPDSPLQALRSFVIGFALIGVAYMAPIVGIITWALVSVFGLGAGTIAFFAALRREYPPKPRAPRTPPTPPPSPTPEGGASGHPSSTLPDAPLTAAPRVPGSASDVDARAERLPETAPPSPPEPPSGPSPPAASASGPLLAFPRAGFLDRVAAFALDCVLVAIAVQLLDFRRQDGMFFFILLSYHIAFWTWKATTLGGIIVGLRLIRTNGEPLRFVDTLVRGLGSLFSFAALGIGCFWMLQDAERQTWHDKIAGTYVVKVPRNMPL